MTEVAGWKGPRGWALFFPEQEEEGAGASEGLSSVVSKLEQFLLSDAGRGFLTDLHRGISRLAQAATVRDRAELLRPEIALEDWAEAAPGGILDGYIEAVFAAPEKAIACLGLAICRAVEQLAGNANPGLVSPRNVISPTLVGFKARTRLRNVKGHSVDKLVVVSGNVIRVSPIRQQVTSMLFQCTKCGDISRKKFPDFKYLPPMQCSMDGCRSLVFAPDTKSAETVDWQRIRLQETQETRAGADGRLPEPGEEDDLAGRMPRTIDVELVSHLVDSCIPGDSVSVVGIVKALSADAEPRRSGPKNGLHMLYIAANSVETARKTKTQRSKARDKTNNTADHLAKGSEEFCSEDFKMIQDVVECSEDLFSLLVHSICPAIYGHNTVKAGLLLSLMGGTRPENFEDADHLDVRTDIHTLIVGDPGLGKSQMLKAVSRIAPRSVYICGNTATTAGLTVTVAREPGTGEYALEAGAMVLGDRGVCCIDEFDKMGADHHALLEAMEQQSVSVAKAGMLCNLSARTSVIAAANPVGGHYTQAKSVCENLKIPAPLLSRFDLVFVLLDKPDQHRDRFISKHVMSGVRAKGRLLVDGGIKEVLSQAPSQFKRQKTWDDSSCVSAQRPSMQINASRQELKERLHSMHQSIGQDTMPPGPLRKYITYARMFVRPKLSRAAVDVIQNFYLALREGMSKSATAGDTLPVTTRQLESIIRLAEARAKCELRTTVTADDAMDVVELVQDSMLDTYSDECGRLDFGRAGGMSKNKMARKLLAALQAERERSGTQRFSDEDVQNLASRIGLRKGDLGQIMESLNQQGFVLRKSGKAWQVAGGIL